MDPFSSKAIDDKRPTLESQSVDFCDTREWRAERKKGQNSQTNKIEKEKKEEDVRGKKWAGTRRNYPGEKGHTKTRGMGDQF